MLKYERMMMNSHNFHYIFVFVVDANILHVTKKTFLLNITPLTFST